MSAVKAGSKELRAMVRDLRKGLVVESDGKAKVRIVDAMTGLPLRYENGQPVGMPNSPCGRTVNDLRRRLRAVGALKEGK
jgi:hypothetical protein